MSEKITKKRCRELYGLPIGFYQCTIDNLLWDRSPDYHIERVEGWACDIYYFVEADKAISYGFAPYGRMVKNSRDIIKSYDNKAKDLIEDYRNKAYKLDDEYQIRKLRDDTKDKIYNLWVELLNIVEY